MSYIGEADEMLYKQEDREEKRRQLLAKGWNADVAEPCEAEGCIEGKVARTVDGDGCFDWLECPRCLGTGVQA